MTKFKKIAVKKQAAVSTTYEELIERMDRAVDLSTKDLRQLLIDLFNSVSGQLDDIEVTGRLFDDLLIALEGDRADFVDTAKSFAYYIFSQILSTYHFTRLIASMPELEEYLSAEKARKTVQEIAEIVSKIRKK